MIKCCEQCGNTDFEVEVEDNVVKICCKACNTVYFSDEITGLQDIE